MENEIIPQEEIGIDPTITDAPDNGGFQKLVDYCLDLLTVFEGSAYRKAKIDEIKRSREVYDQVEKKVNFPWDNASNIVLPLTMITVDNLEPRLVAGLVGKTPVVNFGMDGMTKKDDITMILEDWYNSELTDTVHIENEAMTIVHLLLLEGNYFAVPQYDSDDIIRRDFQYDQAGNVAIDPQTQTPVMREYKETVFDGGKIENVPFTDILCADDLGTIEVWNKADKARYIRPTYGELMNKRDAMGYMNIGPWLIGHKGGRDVPEEDKSPGQAVAGVDVTGKETIKCAEFHVSYCINKDEDAEEGEQRDFTEERLIVTIALDSKMLIRLVKQLDVTMQNNCLIKRIRMFPEANRSFGTGIYGKIKGIQDGASDFFNAVLNSADICMLPWYFYEESSGVRGDQKIYPGKGVPVDSVKGILFPNFNVNPAAYLSFVEVFIQLWERAGSIANPQMGRPNEGKKTATEIMTVVQEGNIKFNYQAQTTKDEFIDLLQTLYDLYYQYMPFNKQFVYAGKPVQIPRQAMRRGYKFSLSGSTETANKMIERKETEDLLALTQNNPLCNPMEPLKDLLKAYGRTDVDSYINPQINALIKSFLQNPEIPQVIQSYLKTKAETAQVVTGGLQK